MFRGRLEGVVVYDWRATSSIFVYTRQNALSNSPVESTSYNSLKINKLWSIT